MHILRNAVEVGQNKLQNYFRFEINDVLQSKISTIGKMHHKFIYVNLGSNFNNKLLKELTINIFEIEI